MDNNDFTLPPFAPPSAPGWPLSAAHIGRLSTVAAAAEALKRNRAVMRTLNSALVTYCQDNKVSASAIDLAPAFRTYSEQSSLVHIEHDALINKYAELRGIDATLLKGRARTPRTAKLFIDDDGKEDDDDNKTKKRAAVESDSDAEEDKDESPKKVMKRNERSPTPSPEPASAPRPAPTTTPFSFLPSAKPFSFLPPTPAPSFVAPPTITPTVAPQEEQAEDVVEPAEKRAGDFFSAPPGKKNKRMGSPLAGSSKEDLPEPTPSTRDTQESAGTAPGSAASGPPIGERKIKALPKRFQNPFAPPGSPQMNGGAAKPSAPATVPPTTSFVPSLETPPRAAPPSFGGFGSAQPSTVFPSAPTLTFGNAPSTGFGSAVSPSSAFSAAPKFTFGGAAAPTTFGSSTNITFGSSAAPASFGSAASPPKFTFGASAAPASFGSAASPPKFTFGASVAPATFPSAFGTPASFPPSDKGATSGFSAGVAPMQPATPFSFSQLNVTTTPITHPTQPRPAADNDDGEDDDDAVQDEQVDLKEGEGEEQETTLHELRCRLFGLADQKWSPIGVGQLKIKQDKTTGKGRLLLRADGSGRVFLNAAIYQGMKTVRKTPTEVNFLAANAPSTKIAQYTLRFKGPDAADEFEEGVSQFSGA
ncbi:hypothetical protein DFJ77DRAFT_471733 [Powellomyces hirtus]|nr:hypothetical protein DFJ77DRAFT_471733 [Powellomyces hirtus]